MKTIGWIGIVVIFPFLHLAITSGGETAEALFGLGVLAGLGAIFWAGWKQTKIWYGVLVLMLFVAIPLWLFFVEHQN